MLYYEAMTTKKMSIDKSWINLKDHFCDEYWEVMKDFIESAKNFVNDRG